MNLNLHRGGRGFETGEVRVGFLSDKFAFGNVFLQALRFCCVSILPLGL